ncbi:hypothetical protein TWF730_008703 [Orbilia blumenaviensis]|uniref:Uncharacterized protein n=1 Tax=Orbilia blumenaviensis TaxID=1796055 RepID=A0AAV9V347_9PEZI
MKPTAAGTLLPTIFYTLTLLSSSSSAYVVPAFNPGISNTPVPDQALAQAQQQTIFTAFTTLTIPNSRGGDTTLLTVAYPCTQNANSGVVAYSISTTLEGGIAIETSFPIKCPAKAEESKSGLSQGAIVGIAVGVSIPVLAVVFFVFWRMWKKAQDDAAVKDKAFHQTRGTPTLHSRRNKSISTVTGDTEGLTVPGRGKSRGGVVTEITAGN